MRMEETMKSTLARFCACATALVAVVAVTCSECRSVEPVSTVPTQVAAAVYIQHWSQILWGMVTSQTGTEEPSFGDPVFNADGSVSQSFTTADGTEAVLTAFEDGSVRLEIVLPDGTTQTVLQSVPVFDGVSRTTTDWHVTSSKGLSVDYTSIVDDRGTIFDISDDTTELTGSAVLPGGITQTFSVLTADGTTAVQAEQSDGSTFGLTVPLASPMFMHPDPSQSAIGSFTDPGFAMDFVLASTPKYPSRWAALLSDLGGGLTGAFSLNADFSGFGQLTDGGTPGDELAALVSWTQDGESEVYLLDGQSRSVGPAGAALDYLEHRWLTLTALLAPAPGASMSALPALLRSALHPQRGFTDVPLDHWAYLDIYRTATASIVQGYPDGSYHPAETVTRAQMAVYISRALAGADWMVPEPAVSPSFPDVPTDHWAYRHVEYALDRGVARGYPDGEYKPELAMDRGQMAAYVARAKGWVGADDDMSAAPELFADVPAGFWAGTAIQACVDNGVVRGYDDGCYRPEATLTRDQMAVYVASAFDLPM
jgi:hypothetical protein